MKRLLFSVICNLIAISLFAITPKGILDKAASSFKSAPYCDVDYNIIVGKDSESGKITIQGNKFHNKMSNMEIWFDGNNMWSLNKDNDEVNLTTPTPQQVAKINPYSFLNIYKTGFKIESGKSAKDYHEVILTALNQKSSISKMIIRVNKTSYQIQYIKMMHAKSGDMEIKVTSYKKGTQKKHDSAFKFNKQKYPNTDIIDLR